MLNKDDFYNAANVKQHDEFQKFLYNALFDKNKRENFYRDLLDIDWHLNEDLFKDYFEQYAAERKSFQQDFTPHSVASLATVNVTENDRTFTDQTAGTGVMIVEMWDKSRKMQHPFYYLPSDYWFEALELSNTAVVYLIHNMAIRGMNGAVIHGDALSREAKQVYFLQNTQDNATSFSNINVMPHSDEVAERFDIRKWVENEIDYKENTLEDLERMVYAIHCNK